MTRSTRLSDEMPMTSPEQFQAWLAAMDDELDRLAASLAPEGVTADGSVGSLDAVEAWLLGRFATVDEGRVRENRVWLDRAARYVGETFTKHIPGRWRLCQDPESVYFGLPVVEDRVGEHSPLSLVMAALGRRRGDYLSGVLSRRIEKGAPQC